MSRDGGKFAFTSRVKSVNPYAIPLDPATLRAGTPALLDSANSILIPSVVDIARKYKSPLTGQPAMVVAAGGIYNGRSLASSLMQGAQGVWVGTRFVASTEAGCSQMHKENVVTADFTDTGRTLVVSGRPLRVKYNDYIKEWHEREDEIKKRSARQAVAGEAEDERAPSMGAKSLCIPFDQAQFGDISGKKCPQCGADAKRWTMFGRSS